MKKFIKILLIPIVLLAPSTIVAQIHNNLPQFDKIRNTHIENSDTKCSADCEVLIIKRKCLEKIFESNPEKNTFFYKELSFLSDNSYLQCAAEKAMH